jgi:hypothetical protein
VGDFHALAKFGELVFGDEKGVAPTPVATPPVSRPNPLGPPIPPRVGPKAAVINPQAGKPVIKQQAVAPAPGKKSAKQ